MKRPALLDPCRQLSLYSLMTNILQPAGALPAATPAAAAASPRVPLAPVLSLRSFAPLGGARLPSVLDAGASRLVTSGRIAIGMALREMGLGPGDAVLVPAYHTLSMVAPLLWAGVEPVFYEVRPDATVDPRELERRRTPAVRAVLATHYFGFHQDMAALRAWCDGAGVRLVEDCAHCWFGELQGRPVGAWGDYAIASSMKFYPAYEGGCLVSARHALAAPPAQSAGLGFEAKSALAALERAFAHDRLGLLEALLALPLRLKDALWQRAKRSKAKAGAGAARPAAAALAPDSSDSSVRFDPAWLDRRSALFSRAVLRLANPARIVGARRANYRRLEAALAGLPGLRPLHPALPDGVCPWVLPMLCEAPEPLFAALQARGVPLLRFASVHDPATHAFPTSAALVRQVLGFPVHQELREEELRWLCESIRAAVQEVAEAVRA